MSGPMPRSATQFSTPPSSAFASCRCGWRIWRSDDVVLQTKSPILRRAVVGGAGAVMAGAAASLAPSTALGNAQANIQGKHTDEQSRASRSDRKISQTTIQAAIAAVAGLGKQDGSAAKITARQAIVARAGWRPQGADHRRRLRHGFGRPRSPMRGKAPMSRSIIFRPKSRTRKRSST